MVITQLQFVHKMYNVSENVKIFHFSFLCTFKEPSFKFKGHSRQHQSYSKVKGLRRLLKTKLTLKLNKDL